MFESRLQFAQAFLFVAGILLLVCVLTWIFESVVVGVFFLVVSHAAAGIGCHAYALSKGYPPWLGAPLGVAFGVCGAIFLGILPDETKVSLLGNERRLASEALRNARNRDKGYEVLDDDVD